MIAKAKRSLLHEAWRIAKVYWTSEEKWSAWGLLGLIIAINLGNVFVGIQLNQWQRAFYNALQVFDSGELLRQLGWFFLFASSGVTLTVNALYFNQMLQIRWRRWLTEKYLNQWLTNQAYYQLQLKSTIDNPDQRISEDVQLFTTQACTLGLGLFTSVVGLGSFLVILWGLSGTGAISLGKFGTIYIPGYLVWAALLYAGVATFITTKIGRALVPLNFRKQRFEGDFRFSLVRIRENAESVASYGGERVELGVFKERFNDVADNFRRIMKRQMRLGWFTNSCGQVALVFPYLVVSPRYFAKQMPLGSLMQVVNAFVYVSDRLSYITNAYSDIVAWFAVTERLAGFEEKLEELRNPTPEGDHRIAIRRGGASVSVDDLDLDLPDGSALLRGVSCHPPMGSALLISGPTGTGKSTLLRAIAGIWPFGRGNIRIGEGGMLLVPQRPYLPQGTLANALTYPSTNGKSFTAAELGAALGEVGLGSYASQLDVVDNWGQRMSLGEQQRLAFARVLLAEPALVFLDEATSGLDEAGEARLYGFLRSAPWQPTVVSVGHRSTLIKFHDAILDLAPYIPLKKPVVLPLPNPPLEDAELVPELSRA
ncbi:MAG: ABC transporter ATP-binding protein/permease [Verrucomicrobia bacterium]|nr:ABC transporter ATP-binding protein/permease [Verrucomicrobiota bacterium]